MSNNHDENKDLRLVSKVTKIDYSNKTISAPKSATIGNRTWGRIDYLTNYCGWTFIWNNNVHVSSRRISSDNDSNTVRKREAKKAAKENTLTNKKRKNNGKSI